MTRQISIVLVLVLFCAAILWLARQQRIGQAQTAVAELRERQAQLERQVVAVTVQFDAAGRALQLETARTRRITRDEAREGRVAESDPPTESDTESAWAEPPQIRPEWRPDSPYVWLRKEMLPELSVAVFQNDGALTGEMAEVLAVSIPQWRRLNASLREIVAGHRALESARVEFTDEHLPGIVGEGPKLTLIVPASSEHGAAFREQVEGLLHDELGPQRAELILTSGWGEHWLDREFSNFGDSPKVISMIQHEIGRYNTSIQSGSFWLSVGGNVDPRQYVPLHLLPFFMEVAGELGFEFPESFP